MMRSMALLLGMLAGSVQADALEGKVTRVSDGDTLWVAVDSKRKPLKLRLQGLDAPEICQRWGKQAQQALSARLLGQAVRVNILARDPYQRSLARITHRGQDVGQWLVGQGHAWSYSYQAGQGAYAREHAQAQTQRIGLWASQDRPIAPHIFRKQQGSCER
jgi:micrococcal nuclease